MVRLLLLLATLFALYYYWRNEDRLLQRVVVTLPTPALTPPPAPTPVPAQPAPAAAPDSDHLGGGRSPFVSGSGHGSPPQRPPMPQIPKSY